MKPRFTRRSFCELPGHVQQAFASAWKSNNFTGKYGWKLFVSGDYAYIMNRRDEWYAAKYD